MEAGLAVWPILNLVLDRNRGSDEWWGKKNGRTWSWEHKREPETSGSIALGVLYRQRLPGGLGDLG